MFYDYSVYGSLIDYDENTLYDVNIRHYLETHGLEVKDCRHEHESSLTSQAALDTVFTNPQVLDFLSEMAGTVQRFGDQCLAYAMHLAGVPVADNPVSTKDCMPGWKQLRQVFTRTQGERMAGAFNALAARKGGKFRGLPIYAGHPDADPARWPDERRLGGVVGVEARADGLYVRAAWNDLGEQNRTQGYLVYPSPAWLYDARAAQASGVIAPDELRSVGLTNTPRLPDVPAWTNSEKPFSETQIETQPMNYKLLLTQHLGLPEDASDELIQQAHEDRQRTAEAAREEATAACAERDLAVADARRFRAAAVNAQLDAAINAGRLSAAEREGFAGRFERDYEETLRTLGERRPALNTQPLGLRPTAAGLDLSTAHGRATAFNARLDTLMRPVAAGGRGLRFDAAIAEMRGSAEDAALLQAMNGK